MKKNKLVQERKEQARREENEVNRRKAAELNLGFVAVDIPPEEVDIKAVKRTQLNAFLSMVPYTNAWYESQAALAEMDDLKRIRIERVKAEDLHLMTKIGKHDEALEKMMAETNYDFFYFNKLKDKHEKEGKWTFTVPNLNPFGYLSVGKDRNRLKKAFNSSFKLIETEFSDLGAKVAKETSADIGTLPCLWRGKNKNGEGLKCKNKRMENTLRKVQGRPEIMSYCCYHATNCFGENHKPEDGPVKVNVPNQHALCVECYTLKFKKKLPPISMESAPGVVPVMIMSTMLMNSKQNSADVEQSGQLTLKSSLPTDPAPVKRKKKATTCQWKPNKGNEKLRLWMCSNSFFVDPTTGKMYETCGMHITSCIRAHEPNTNSIVTVPNIYGLCSMHHLAEHGKPPTAIPFPFPGMKMRQAADFWKSGKGRHWATPKWEPPRNIRLHNFEEPEPPDIFDIILKFIKRFRFGKKAVSLIQRVYRGYRCRKAHVPLRLHRDTPRRRTAAIAIQAQMRKFLGTKYMGARRRKFVLATVNIQRSFRGWACRRWLRIDWAARRITKLMKKLRLFKFKDTVIMVIQLRRMFLRRANAALQIQRFFRGFMARNSIFKNRLWEFISNRSARVIQKFYLKEKERIRRSRLKRKGESWALEQCAKKLSRMILEMYLDRQRRKELSIMMNKSAPEIQRLVRGFLAKAGAKKMSYLRNSFKSWLKPRFAIDFLEKTLNSKVFFLKAAPMVVARKAKGEKPQFVRPFLKDEMKSQVEVDYRSFDTALELWYQNISIPLSKAEKEAIKRTFKNPMNGNIGVALLDEFIALHKLPCRKHGRTVCCDCTFRRECMLKGCNCQKYESKKPTKRRFQDASSICKFCDHPGTLHILCPLQLQEKELSATNLIGIMNATREPDMSMPISLKGLPLDEALIPKLTADEERFNHLKSTKAIEKVKSLTTANEVRSLTKSLCYFDVAGNEVYDNNEYWMQNSSETLRNTAGSSNTSVSNIDVRSTDLTPNYNVTSSEFWHITPLNPNKSVRDYHERFEHNMPVPITNNGQLQYTFEGPKVYYNILNQLIRMEKNIDADDADFLKLIVDNIQIFERHWRKMVADIRTAKLDRNLEVPRDARVAFEASNLPRPLLASKLDFTFRQLGFHKKVLGKDINIQPFAEKKEWTIKETRINTELKRKTSHPTLDVTHMEEFMRTISRSGLSSQPSIALAQDDKETSRPVSKGLSQTSPHSKPRSQTMSKRQLILQSINGDNGTNSSQGDLKAITIGSSGIFTPFSSQSKRRGSETDVQIRPTTVTSQEVDILNYAQLTAPRLEYNQVLEMPIGDTESSANNRYVCPFPACGKSFHSREAAFRHMPSHELKSRLAAPTPLADSHFSNYWPSDVTWQTVDKFTERVLPPGSWPCTVQGCNAVFAAKTKLDLHTRVVHMHVSNSCLTLGYFKTLGTAISVPPNSLPAGVLLKSHLSFCPEHFVFSSTCTVCVKKAQKRTGPVPPFRFFDGVDLDMKMKRQVVENLSARKADAVVRLECGSWQVGLVVSIPVASNPSVGDDKNSRKASVDTKCRIVSALLDRNDDGWLEVEFLYTHKEVAARGFTPPEEHEQRRELFRSTSIQGANDFGRWVQIARVQNVFGIRLCNSVADMHSYLDDPTESKVTSFFVRNW